MHQIILDNMGDHQHYYATDHTEHWSEQLPEHLHQFIEENWHKIPGQEHEHHQTDTSPVEETEVEESSNPIVLMFTAGLETGSTIIESIFKFPLELMSKISEI